MNIKLPFFKKRIIIHLDFTVVDNVFEKYYFKIYEELKKKYPNVPDSIIRRSAKTGYKWLISIVKNMPKEHAEKIIERQLNKSVEISENWLKEWTKAMYE